ncbi:MAG: DNA polymerase III subunit gamma/tau [Treponema sp.]|jgi:DNA polymerase-3 subunit gamma/tau|nr:DNA polymerase III subunit gamma/tau [Treponema sp.]
MAEEASAGKKFEVTATRRRPKTFDELAGQDFVAATLKNSIETGHIAHAYLFSGPRGCGKTSAARILARSLNCEKGPTAAPCGLCSSCLEISRGASLDIIEIDGASNTSVNDVRQIKDEVLFPPNSGRYKIYIIDEVHMLSNSAFNALLKTIEEPPPYIVFIFATTELHKVPATIKSRCQQFNFRLIPIETIRAILQDTCKEMQIQAEDEALFWIAKESTGSLRDAYTLFDQVVSFSEGTIRAELIREKLGLVGLDKLNALAEACAANDAAASLAIIDAVLEAGIAIEQFVIDLAGYYRSLLLIKNGVLRESLLGYGADRFSAKPLEKLDALRLEQALSLLLDLYRNIRYSVSPRFELENAVSKLCWLDRWVSPAELRAAVTEVREILGREGGLGRPLAVPEPADYPPVPADAGDSGARGNAVPAGTSSGAAVSPPEPGSAAFRQELIVRLRQERGILASALDGSLPWEWEGDKLVIPVRDAFKIQLLQKDKALISRVLAALTGKDPVFEVVQRNAGGEFPAGVSRARTGETPELSPQAERVRRVFQGTVVKDRME